MGKRRRFHYFVVGCLALIFGLALPLGVNGIGGFLDHAYASKKITLSAEKEYAFTDETFQLTVSDEGLAEGDQLTLELPKNLVFMDQETQLENENKAIKFDEASGEITIPYQAFKEKKAELILKSKKSGTYDLLIKKQQEQKTVYSNSLNFAVIDKKAETDLTPKQQEPPGTLAKTSALIQPRMATARAGSTAYVTSATEMDAAMANAAITEVVVMNDFAFTQFSSTVAGESNQTIPARDLTVRGVNPGVKVDFRRRSYWMDFASKKVNVQVQDLDMYGQNYWGPIRLTGTIGAASTFSIQNLNYTGAQFTASYQADFFVGGTVVNKSVNQYISPFDNVEYKTQVNQTNLEVTNITFEAGSKYTGTTENATVLMLGTGGATGTATIQEGAELNLTGGGNGLSGEGTWTTIQANGNVDIAKNAKVNITTPKDSTRGGIALGSNAKLLVHDGASLNLDMNGPFTDAYNKNPINVGTGAEFNVADGASLTIMANNQGTGTGSLVKTGSNSSFVIGKKGVFKLSSDGSGAKNLISIGTTSTFNFVDAGEIDLDARRNTNANTRVIYMASGTFSASIQRVKAWTAADAGNDTPTYDWFPMYDMQVKYTGANVTSATGNSIVNANAVDFAANYRTQNFKRVLFEHIADVEVSLDPLADNPANTNSHVIRGVANPGAWVLLSGDSAIPEGTIAAQAESDTKKYHVKADSATGEFVFVLPEGNYLTAGNTVSAYAYLDGKDATASTVVADETAPDKPSLNAIKDVDASLTGKAEANSLVTVYRASDKAVLGSVNADASGNYELVLADSDKPLAPYVGYYAISADAAGNKSEQSDTKVVQDTTPPSAEAVKQIVNLNEAFTTDAKSLVTNVQDNAGVGDDNLTYVITKVPDLTAVGSSTAEVTITDKAGNHVVIVVPVFVKDGDTTVAEQAMIQASDFVVKEKQVPTSEADWDAFIISQAKAKAWGVPDGADLSAEITVADRGGFAKAAGTYTIKVKVKDAEKIITAIVTPGTLSISEIPNTIQFGTQQIRSYEQQLKPENEAKVVVNDDRSDPSSWQLTAMLESPFKTNEADELPDSLVIAMKGADGTVKYEPINEQGTTPVFNQETASEGLTEVNLNPTGNVGLMLDLFPGNIRSGKVYQTKIVWTLENTP
ncbi:pectate lyase-like adhesive domain-containing protein [Listeria kieliensis]|uniref:pectate lyase-like adhesive domain-containing protein n=1 Tax=Listeria kieliensis TaxID=1621700 RepID=UPI00105857E5|nr:pectate lyase-like adhesive domain-containing protein [Listeria kieliensis]